MPYMKRSYVRRMPGRRPMMGLGALGAYSDSTQCSEIPLGDPYRKPGNYCATPDGGMTTFNADGTTYRQPGYTVDPDPAHPVGASGGSSSGPGIVDTFFKLFAPTPTAVMPAPGPGGMSTTTMVMLAGGAVLVAVLLARR